MVLIQNIKRFNMKKMHLPYIIVSYLPNEKQRFVRLPFVFDCHKKAIKFLKESKSIDWDNINGIKIFDNANKKHYDFNLSEMI